MLKSIDPLPNGTLLAPRDDRGHGNEIVITGASFGAGNVATRLVDLPGTAATGLLDAIPTVFPLYDFVEKPIYDAFQASADPAEGRSNGIEIMAPATFVERMRDAYAVIASGERRL